MDPYLLFALIASASLLAVISILAIKSRWIQPDRFALILWIILIAHRNLLPRQLAALTELSLSDPLLVVEACMTGLLAVLTLVATFMARTCFKRPAPSVIYLLIGYAAAVTMTSPWSSQIFYSAFWTIRLWCVALLPLVYFRTSQSPRAPKQFLDATIVGLLPVLVIAWIGLFTTGASRDGRVYSLWVGAIMPSLLAFTLSTGYVTRMILRPWRPVGAMIAAGMIATAVMTGSKNGFLCSGVALGLMLLCNFRRLTNPLVAIPFCLLCLLIAVAAPRDIGLVGHFERYNEGSQSTVRDRLILWKDIVLPRILESPLVGRGFATSSVDRLAVTTIGWEAGHAHNSTLNSLMEVGVLGSVPLFLMIAGVFMRLWSHTRLVLNDGEVAPLFASWLCLFLCGFGELIFGGSLQPAAYLFYAPTSGVCTPTAVRDRKTWRRQCHRMAFIGADASLIWSGQPA